MLKLLKIIKYITFPNSNFSYGNTEVFIMKVFEYEGRNAKI